MASRVKVSRLLSEASPSELLVFGLIVLLFAYSTWAYLPPREETTMDMVTGGFWMCLDYIKDGTLYGGQPYCAQGPGIFYLGYLFQQLFGDDMVVYCLWVVALACNVTIFLVFRRILKDAGVYHPIVYTVLYLLMVYPFMRWITVILSMGLFTFGYYSLFLSRFKDKAAIAGVFMAASIFTKYTLLMPTAILLAYYVLRDGVAFKGLSARLKNRKQTLAKAADVAVVAAICLAVLVILVLTYRNFLTYTWYAQQEQMKIGSDTLGILFKGLILDRDPVTYSAIVLFIVLLYCILKGYFDKNTLIFPLMQLTAVFYGPIFILSRSTTYYGSYYLLPAYPFLLASLMVLWKRSVKIFAFLVLITVLYPSIFVYPQHLGVQGTTLWDLTRPQLAADDKFVEDNTRIVEWGMHFIPRQTGYVLTEWWDIYKSIDSYQIPIDKRNVVTDLEVMGRVRAEDQIWAPLLRSKINVTLGYWQPSTSPSRKEMKYINEIRSGKYSLILNGPPDWASMTRILIFSSDYLKTNYCAVYVPNFRYRGFGGSESTMVLLRDKSQCEAMKTAMVGYYTANFNKVCAVGQNAVNVVLNNLRQDGYDLNLVCTNEKDFARLYDDAYLSELKRFRLLDAVLVALLYLPVYCVALFVRNIKTRIDSP